MKKVINKLELIEKTVNLKMWVSNMKTNLVLFGGAGGCFPLLFVGRLICTILFLLPPPNVLSLAIAPSINKGTLIATHHNIKQCID